MRGRTRRQAISTLGILAATLSATPSHAEPVTFDTPLTTLTGHLLRPSGYGPFPAVVALHGCGGLYGRDGRKFSSRHRDWADRLVGAGFVVLFPDSFTARGVREICTQRTRTITPRDRSNDARAAIAWLAGQPGVDSTRLHLLGWSHGAMSLLWTLRPGFLDGTPKITSAIGFYPGCREIARLEDWRPSVPLTVLMGEADDWTAPGPCRALAARAGFRFIGYPGAYHGFDTPDAPVRQRTDIGQLPGGVAHVGTDPAARAAAITEVMAILTGR